MTRALAREVGSRGITVNAVAPGFIDTDMTRALGEQHAVHCGRRYRWGGSAQSEDIGVASCSSRRARAATSPGATLHVNGGMYMN